MFYLPTNTILAVVLTSALCAVLSSALPARSVARKPIAALMRSTE